MHRRAEGRAGEIVARETIAAIATPAGEGAISLVRVSGENAIPVAERIFRGNSLPSQFKSHTQHLGQVLRKDTIVDQVVLSVHRAPHSFTGEDLVEISGHGGALVTARVLEACLEAGARAARPGEFSERAYLNGKLDLTQAEAVIDLIRAQTDLALRSANEQLAGRLGEEFRDLRSELIAIVAHLEADLDFPEEGIAPNDFTTIRCQLETWRDGVDRLLATAETGRILRDGLRVVIFGATNAGKSSLLNRLLGYERAIVSDLPGTTRDTIEERAQLRGIVLRLLDTAGLRQPENAVEAEGIARTTQSLQIADFRLHLVDGSQAAPEDFATDEQELLVLNKTDLAEHDAWKSTKAVRISCVSGAGFADLEEELFRRLGGLKLRPENPVAINARHREHLRLAHDAAERALAEMRQGASAEITVFELRAALRAFDDLLGMRDEESVRDAIFREFCIGK